MRSGPLTLDDLSGAQVQSRDSTLWHQRVPSFPSSEIRLGVGLGHALRWIARTARERLGLRGGITESAMVFPAASARVVMLCAVRYLAMGPHPSRGEITAGPLRHRSSGRRSLVPPLGRR